MGRALAWRLVFGLFLLALLSPSQGGENKTATEAPHNHSVVTPMSLNINTTTKGHGNCLQSTTGLFILSVSLLYFC
ncbi:signal transducer CD24 [Protobothrops mucrosquamatus]|uniref:signal transducer CD24 n=1 Tax=Protobothrops mucrosquamatus TaxID=103944 RepID=UPI0010FB3156|nr:signal transducer CD24 [Protobothrops mucrosquamatus]